MEYINLQQVTTIEVELKKKNKYFQYIEKVVNKNFSNKIFNKESFIKKYYKHCNYFGESELILELDEVNEFAQSKNSYVDALDKHVYYNPHINIWTSDQNSHTKRFKNELELFEYIKCLQDI